jgi:hypothetical protein
MFIVACWLTLAALLLVGGLNANYAIRYWISRIPHQSHDSRRVPVGNR